MSETQLLHINPETMVGSGTTNILVVNEDQVKADADQIAKIVAEAKIKTKQDLDYYNSMLKMLKATKKAINGRRLDLNRQNNQKGKEIIGWFEPSEQKLAELVKAWKEGEAAKKQAERKRIEAMAKAREVQLFEAGAAFNGSMYSVPEGRITVSGTQLLEESFDFDAVLAAMKAEAEELQKAKAERQERERQEREARLAEEKRLREEKAEADRKLAELERKEAQRKKEEDEIAEEKRRRAQMMEEAQSSGPATPPVSKPVEAASSAPAKPQRQVKPIVMPTTIEERAVFLEGVRWVMQNYDMPNDKKWELWNKATGKTKIVEES